MASERSKRGFRIAVGAAMIAATIGLFVGLHPAHPTTIRGVVRCAGGDSLDGVWVVASASDSGWATIVHDPNDASAAAYTYELSVGGTYQLHVGCGGTATTWTHADYSPYVSDPRQNFSCTNSPVRTRVGRCVTVP